MNGEQFNAFIKFHSSKACGYSVDGQAQIVAVTAAQAKGEDDVSYEFFFSWLLTHIPLPVYQAMNKGMVGSISAMLAQAAANAAYDLSAVTSGPFDKFTNYTVVLAKEQFHAAKVERALRWQAVFTEHLITPFVWPTDPIKLQELQEWIFLVKCDNYCAELKKDPSNMEKMCCEWLPQAFAELRSPSDKIFTIILLTIDSTTEIAINAKEPWIFSPGQIAEWRKNFLVKAAAHPGFKGKDILNDPDINTSIFTLHRASVPVSP